MEIQRYLFQIFWDAGVEENNIGGDQKVVCGICRKPISGPAYKHRYTHLFFHLSCLNLPTNYKALIFHFTSGHRRLIFTGEVKNDDKRRKKLFALGARSRYWVPDTNAPPPPNATCFSINHASSCLPRYNNTPSTQTTPLFKFGQEKPEKKYCNACGINCNRYAFYGCSECDINLDIACATSHSRINNIDDCQHSFISFFKQIQFTCEACGEEGKELASQCSICQLLIHGKCARFSRIIRNARHDHSLVLTYNSLQIPQLKEHLDKSIFCKLCCEKVKTEYAAYCCHECGYVAHLACAFEDEVSANLELLPEEPDDFAADVMEVEGTGQIQHFSHQHDLILSSEELRDDKLCDGCT